MYPPHSDGGYPLLCREAVDELRSRGHQVLVLTGNMGCDGRRVLRPDVWRIFAYCPDNRENELKSGRLVDVWRWYRREWTEHALLNEALVRFKPEVAFVWATKGLSHSIAIALQRTRLPFIAYVCGYWLNHHNQEAHLRRQFQFWTWGHSDGWTRHLKSAIHRWLAMRFPVDYAPLQFDALAYNSRPMQSAIEPLHASRTPPVQIVDSSSMDRFRSLEAVEIAAPIRLLFVGRLHPSKDPLALIRAIGLLQANPSSPKLSLTLVGWQHDAEYASALQAAIAAVPNPDAIAIREPVPFDEMPALFATHQILVAPSLVDPLPRVAAEAMAAGLVCLVSDKTGIAALLADRKEAMIFPAGDEQALADMISLVISDRPLVQSLRLNGRKKALTFFSTQRMVDEMEAFLVSSLERTGTREQPLHRTPTDPLGESGNHPRSVSRDASV